MEKQCGSVTVLVDEQLWSQATVYELDTRLRVGVLDTGARLWI